SMSREAFSCQHRFANTKGTLSVCATQTLVTLEQGISLLLEHPRDGGVGIPGGLLDRLLAQPGSHQRLVTLGVPFDPTLAIIVGTTMLQIIFQRESHVLREAGALEVSVGKGNLLDCRNRAVGRLAQGTTWVIRHELEEVPGDVRVLGRLDDAVAVG